jgi:aspartyl-tRNA(Asn)/glutamyl-tRNA(Gln) amidotransferase subunit A
MASLADLTLVDAATFVRDGEATSRDLLDACWDRMEEVNPTLNATIWTDREGAEAAATAADASRNVNEWSGPLHGVPLAHKDMYYQAGKRSTCGSRLRKDFRPDITSTAIERLTAAGAYSFAGLNMAEFAQNPTGHNREFGDCHNPWNPPYITGGSSSGSGAAVAARFVYAALGSDTGGSIRLPASACGVTGLKPTQTRVSRYGAMPLSFTLDNVGPLARTARDCARVMMLIAGRDPKDPTSSHLPVPDYEGALDGDVRGMRIGIPENYFFDAADPVVTAAVEKAVEVLRARGATVTRLALPVMDAVSGYGSIISRVEAAAIHAEWMRHRAQDYAPHLSARQYLGYAIPGPYYVESLSRRGPVLRAFATEVFAQVDVLATPTIPMALPTLAETDIDNGPPGTETKVLAISANTRPFNYLGLPAISIPCGFDANGLPIGFQLAGRPFAEARLLRLADAYQRDTDWHRRHPPVIEAASGPLGIILA